MNMYKFNNKPYVSNYDEDRQFLFPFLVGAVTGGAAIGLTRPRPIYNVAPNQPYPNPGYTNNYYPYNNFNPYYPPYYR